jgi:purine-binding chemotaxis protein CheW
VLILAVGLRECALRALEHNMSFSLRPASSRQLDTLLFELSGQRFALLVSDVEEVMRAFAVQFLPRAPAVIEGVVNLRGQTLPVIGMRTRFRLPQKALEPSDHFLVVRVGARRVVLRVDAVLGMESLNVLPFEDAPHLPAAIGLVAGVAAVHDGTVLVHDLASFLCEAESTALDESLSAERAEVAS